MHFTRGPAMRPEAGALRVLSTTRAKAKMFEFQVPLEDHIELPRNPEILFSLAVGILGDAAAAIADQLLAIEAGLTDDEEAEHPTDVWDAGDTSLRDSSQEAVTFAATYFDAYLGSRLNESITEEFSLLCAAAYYLADSPGSARVVIKNTPRSGPDFEGGLPHLVHAILMDDFAPLDAQYEYRDTAEPLKSALRAFFAAEGDGTAVVALCQSLRERTYAEGSPRELLYADIAVALSQFKLSNPWRSILPPPSGRDLERGQPPPPNPRFPKELWPAQKRICDAGLLGGRSAVIQMPTSAGKTRATELIVRSAFLSDRNSLAVMFRPSPPP